MGLLKHLLGWPVTGPLFLSRYSVQKTYDVAVEELTDPEPVRERLMELQMKLDAGEIDEQAYLEAEAELMERLREVRAWRREFGLPVRGGPVQTAGPDGASTASLEIDADFE